MSLVVLSFFRDLEQATQLADIVKQAGGVLGAAVCCAENGGDPKDDWTTCDKDRDTLLDRSAIAICIAMLQIPNTLQHVLPCVEHYQVVDELAVSRQ